MYNPNTESAHDLTKTLLRGYEYYHGITRSQYDAIFEKCQNALVQILDWGADPDKLKPVLVEMRDAEVSIFKRREAVEMLWCKCANHIAYQVCSTWEPFPDE